MSDKNDIDTMLAELEDRRLSAQVERQTREIAAERGELGERARLAALRATLYSETWKPMTDRDLAAFTRGVMAYMGETVEELARLMGDPEITPATVSAWASGDRVPTMNQVGHMEMIFRSRALADLEAALDAAAPKWRKE
jgi:hypothetical protein